MIKKPIPIFFNLDGKQSVQSVSAVIHIDDNHTEALDLSLLQGGEHIKTPLSSTVTARFVRVKDKILISDNVHCTVQENGNILIPIDNSAVKMLTGEIKIEVNIVDDNDILTMQFPLVIRVNNTILADSEISPESEGTIPELLEEAKQAALGAQHAAEEATQALDSKQDKLTAGENITIEDNVISATGGTDDYNELSNKPSINGVTLSGNKSSDDLNLQKRIFLRIPPAFPSANYSYGDLFYYESKLYKYAGTSYNPVVGNYILYERAGRRITFSTAQFPPEYTESGTVSEYDTGDIYVKQSSPPAANSQGMLAGEIFICTNVLFNKVSDGVMHYAYFWKKLPFNASTLEEYGITDAYNKTEIDEKLDELKIINAEINSEGHLIITLSDGTEIDAGAVGSPKTDISSAVVTLSSSSFVYDGTSKAPTVSSVVLNGQTLTVGIDYVVVASPAANAGTYTVSVNGIGDYTGVVTANWTISKAQAEIYGDDSIAISGLDEPVTKVYSTDGDGEFSVSISDNIANVSNSGGVVTITPTAYGSATLTVTVAEGTNYLGVTKTVSVTVEEAQTTTVFGVMWDYSLSSPQLTRLSPQTDPLGVVTNVPSREPTACVGNDGNGQSDFDNYMPWAGMQRYNYVNGQVVDFVSYDNGETFVYIPAFWSKIVDDTAHSKMYFYISSEELTGFTKHLGSDRYVGRYELDGNYKSVTGVSPKVNTTLGDFRSGITAIDNNHFQYDFHTYNAIQLLYIGEFANLDSQAMIGAGYVRGNSVVSTGRTNSLIYHTGRISGTDDVSVIQYRWIENLWGNVWSWVDGVLNDSGAFYICNDPTKYSSSITNDYTNIGIDSPSSSGWRKTTTAHNNCYLFPKTGGGSNSTYMCDYSYINNANLCGVLSGGNVSTGTQSYNGLFFWAGADTPSTTNSTFGSRSILVIPSGGGA